METIKDVFANFKLGLAGVYEPNEIEAITLLTISEVCHFSKASIKAFPERQLLGEQLAQLTDVLSQLKTGKPLQYILGRTEFYSLPFLVNPAVLIPRPETEELVEWVLSTAREKQLTTVNVLDIGTGSGCIAISLKKNLPGCNVAAIDISAEALKTAKENAALNNVDIEFIETDILNPVLAHNLQLTTHNNSNSNAHISYLISYISVIVSNPPYVTLHDKTQMHTNVTDFEPHTALFVPQDDPLLFYRAIADLALQRLEPNGLLFFEINESLGNETVDLLKSKGFEQVELRKDLSGRDRMIRASI